MVSQNGIKCVKILDLFRTDSPFSRVKINSQKFGLQISLEQGVGGIQLAVYLEISGGGWVTV